MGGLQSATDTDLKPCPICDGDDLCRYHRLRSEVEQVRDKTESEIKELEAYHDAFKNRVSKAKRQTLLGIYQALTRILADSDTGTSTNHGHTGPFAKQMEIGFGGPLTVRGRKSITDKFNDAFSALERRGFKDWVRECLDMDTPISFTEWCKRRRYVLDDDRGE